MDYCIFLNEYTVDTYHTVYYKELFFAEDAAKEVDDYIKYKEVLPEKIKKADFITLTVGGNDAMSYQLLDLLYRDYIYIDEDNLKRFYGEDLAKKYIALRNKLIGSNSNIKSVFDILDVLLYSMGSAIDGIPQTLDAIHKMNPTAVVALTGLPEIFKGYKIVDGDQQIDIGQLFVPMSKVLNAYIRNVAEERSSYVRYIDIADFENLYAGGSKELTTGDLWSNFLLITHPSEQGQWQIAENIMENFKFSTGVGTVAAIKNYVNNTYTMMMSKSGIAKIQNLLAAIKGVDFSGMLTVLNGLFSGLSGLFSSGGGNQ